ncbi:hypothetical protein HK101_011088 [Irineochytrium annulatum]|nr:hypothetical protein HK101_011085 [Irineochytrium annulatum]KAJ3172872.1 hypothetical protein HK101_011088 [Irineochytrium annulatum]
MRRLASASLRSPWREVHTPPASAGASTSISILGVQYPRDACTNVPPSILAKIPRGLHRVPNHPLNIIKRRIEAYFQRLNSKYALSDSLPPVVTTTANFDDLLIPTSHPSRAPTDTYYVNATHVLRTHTSAHQRDVLRLRPQPVGHLVTADVYRRDEVDVSHYPVFHQMEGIRTFERAKLEEEVEVDRIPERPAGVDITDEAAEPGGTNSVQNAHGKEEAMMVAQHMKRTMEGMVVELFGAGSKAGENGEPLKMRWIEGYFPFTGPSWELEVLYMGKWLELCGCGVIQQAILDETGNNDRVGWAFGFGLERLAMKMFDIPDIRLFWSEDPRFLSQFKSGDLGTLRFQPYSKYPACYKDVSFWIPVEGYHDNDMYELVRDVAGDLVEDVALIDAFVHPKTKRVSKCYRINYRSMDRTFTNDEIDEIQEGVRQAIVERLGGDLR